MFGVQTRDGDTQKPAVSSTPRPSMTRIENHATASETEKEGPQLQPETRFQSRETYLCLSLLTLSSACAPL